MSRKLSKTAIRDLADKLYADALDECCQSYINQKEQRPTTAVIFKERAETKKMIANELYSILDATL